ncbi:CBS domain-containing protein [Candidatus Woesearchaeota archaeon]|nr:CBS domain-containing protein [Candidatus Woesearchaeota archaeon]
MARISKIMNVNPLTVKKEATISEAAKLMANKPHGCVIVTENKKPIGIITDSDLVRNLAYKKINPETKVGQIMSSLVTSIMYNSKLENANKIIDTKGFRRYPVVDKEGYLVGLLSENDVVQAISDDMRFHRSLQNTVLILFVVFEFFVFILYRYMINYFPFLR